MTCLTGFHAPPPRPFRSPAVQIPGYADNRWPAPFDNATAPVPETAVVASRRPSPAKNELQPSRASDSPPVAAPSRPGLAIPFAATPSPGNIASARPPAGFLPPCSTLQAPHPVRLVEISNIPSGTGSPDRSGPLPAPV